MEERYLLLDQLLSNNSYATVERECTVELCNKGSNDDKDEWEIIRSHSLENNLVGGLMTYLSDNNLLSPEETLTVYLNTLNNEYRTNGQLSWNRKPVQYFRYRQEFYCCRTGGAFSLYF